MATAVTSPIERFISKRNQHRWVTDFHLPDGEKIGIWTDVDAWQVRGLQAGDSVLLVRDGKGGWKVFERIDGTTSQAHTPTRPPAPAAAPARAPAAQASVYAKPDPARLREIGGYVSDNVNLFATCFREVEQHRDFCNLTAESKKAVAASVYISACRRFNL